MCGFAGFIGSCGEHTTHRAVAKAMADAIRHRGPNDDGVWCDDEVGVALGHRRLSIIDLSAAGHQPMTSASGRWVIAFNGEIYNFRELKAELEAAGTGGNWNGSSDTEVLLAAVEAWGILGALNRSVGMFAFAAFDRHERTLHLGRDRLGEKPLYYGHCNGVFLFASELSAFHRHPLFEATLDREALSLLLRYNCVPSPYSIFKGVRKLEPGSWLRYSARGQSTLTRYWDAEAIVTSAQQHPFAGSPGEVVDQTERLLRQSLKGQMIADVPLGAFLSGGIDSSTVVAVMQDMSPRPVKTFSIGFHENEYNEAHFAKAVADHLGTDHTELYVSYSDALATVPLMADIYSEPFADDSQIATYLVARMARSHVSVALSGDGGDELFAGYTRYSAVARHWQNLRRVPPPVRRMAARAVTALPPGAADFLGRGLQRALPSSFDWQRPGQALKKAAMAAGAKSVEQLYRQIISQWHHPEAVVIDGQEPTLPGWGNEESELDPVRRMMSADLVGYLPDDVLVKVDRAAMAVSLETRVPFLDHRLVEFSATLPLASLIAGGVSKRPLRQVLARYVPPSLFERPKMGFAVPLARWLRGPLREWAEELLSEERLRNDGIFHHEPIRRAWREHLAGTRDQQRKLWVILMFQAWNARRKEQPK